VPEELENIVKKALAKNQAERYGDANELVSDLSALKQQLDFSTFTGTSEWKFKKKGRKWLFAAVSAAVVVAAVAGVWWIAANREVPSTGLPGRAHPVTSGDSWHGEPALSPDGGTIAYAAEESGNKDIYLIKLAGGNPIRLTDDPAPDNYPAWYPDGSALAFVSERGGSACIWKVPAFGGGATLLVQDAIDPAISPNGLRIAFTALLPNGDQRIGVAPLANPADVTLLTRSEDIAWEHRMAAWSPPDGKLICFATRSDLWIVPASGGPARCLTNAGYSVRKPAWSSDGKYVYFSSAREGTIALWRIAAEGGRAERRTSGSSYEHDPTISRDGSRLAYSTQTEPGSMLVRDLGSGVERKVLGIRDISIAAISPDGSKLVYASDRGGSSFDLWLQPLERGVPTGQPQRLTDDTADASCPAFSPDGKWIAYHRILGKERDIFTVPVSGGKPTQFTNDPAQDTQPSWSNDGTMIVFASDREGGSHIWVAPVSEGKPAGPPRRVTRGTISVGAPVWSHDGASIAYIGTADGDADVYLVPSDGGAPPRRITRSAGAMMVRWDGVTGSLFVSGTWKEDTYSLRRVTLGKKAAAAIDPPVVFGSLTALATFDVSFDGRLVVYGRENDVGNVWVHEAPKKTF
jgi:Tol biopolymer transport system component